MPLNWIRTLEIVSEAELTKGDKKSAHSRLVAPKALARSDENVIVYDTTLRDGSQGESVQFSLEDKLRIARRLDLLGVDFIEGGWPGANPKDQEFFSRMQDVKLETSRLVAFGSTRRARVPVEQDTVIRGLLEAKTSVITIFGKAWTLHVRRALNISLQENLDLIFDSIQYLKARTDTVFFDAEHFFDGYKEDADYAMKVLTAARDAGAQAVILCDTNGGTLPTEVARIMRQANLSGTQMGIHCHNDGGVAVANTLAAVESGAMHVQGTINGLGERCGNADLTTVIPNLVLKMGRATKMGAESLAGLTGVSRFVDEMCNRSPQKSQPFVGSSAFAHKGGVHVSAVLKEPTTYEHIDPQQVGAQRRILISEQAGRSNLLFKLQDFGDGGIDLDDPRLKNLLQEIKDLEFRGYQFDAAEASFELRICRALGILPEYFKLISYRGIDDRRKLDDHHETMENDVVVKLLIGGRQVHQVGGGSGPVDALYAVMYQALEWYYPSIQKVKLVDYKVRILNGSAVGGSGTESKVRVLIEWHDGVRSWGTVGVSTDILAASYDAMEDALMFKLYKDKAIPAG